MSGKTMSNWETALRRDGEGELADKVHTEKSEDMIRLQQSGLPQFDYLEIPYADFTENNRQLIEFISKYIQQGKGFCIRALPTEEGRKRELTREPTKGYLNYESMENFLEKVIRGDENLWTIGLSDWEPNEYGGIIVIKNFSARGEITRELDRLTAGKENPLAGFKFDGEFGRAKWYIEKEESAKEELWRAFQIVGENPRTNRKGYFEFIVTEKSGEIKFLDYKINETYLNLI